MRKDKAVCWHESSLPLYHLGECDNEQLRWVESKVARWLAAAELAAMYLRNAVKDAWFSGNARGDFGHIDATFWGATEAPFYRHLQALIEAARSGAEHLDLPTREAWHATLIRCALRLFDQTFVGAGTIERQNPRRTALAHKQPRSSLHGPKLRLALGLPVDEPKPKPARKLARKSSVGPARAGCMNPINFRQNQAWGDLLLRWWQGLDDDRGGRAALRRAPDITAVVMLPAYQRLHRRLSNT